VGPGKGVVQWRCDCNFIWIIYTRLY